MRVGQRMKLAELEGQPALMVYRKGELTSAGIDRGWPHQVALLASFVVGRQYMILHRFCNGLSLCPRRQHYQKGDTEFVVPALRISAMPSFFRCTLTAS